MRILITVAFFLLPSVNVALAYDEYADPEEQQEGFGDEDYYEYEHQNPSDINDRSITICIDENRKEATIKGKALHFFTTEGELIGGIDQKNEYTLHSAPDGIVIGSLPTEHRKLIARSTIGYIQYNGKSYREDLQVVQDPDNNYNLVLVNEISMESYLYGLINKESLPGWKLEAKKAQAVAARTYAMYRKLERPARFCDLGHTAIDQVYGGLDSEDENSRLAVSETHGEVLTYDNRIVKSYYHSCCGGYTASAEEVWGRPVPYLPGVRCDGCKACPNDSWEFKISMSDLGAKLGVPQASRGKFFIDVVQRGISGRASKIRIKYGSHTEIMNGENFRSRLGYNILKSTRFTFNRKGGTYIFKGRGLGHGVGMCQWGAAGMAESGSAYREILYYFYPGTLIRRVY